MRTLLLLALLPPAAAYSADTHALSMRQKLNAKVMNSAKAIPAPPPKDEEKPADGPPPVVMKPVIISDSKLIDAVTAAIEREEEDRRESKFTPLDGGQIARIGPVVVGGWWSFSEGWTFLRLNKARTRRQVEAADARLKELQELAALAEKPKP